MLLQTNGLSRTAHRMSQPNQPKKHQEHVRMQLTSLGIQDTLTFVQDPASVLPAELARYLPAGQLVHATAYSPEYFPAGHCAYTSVWLVNTC